MRPTLARLFRSRSRSSARLWASQIRTRLRRNHAARWSSWRRLCRCWARATTTKRSPRVTSRSGWPSTPRVLMMVSSSWVMPRVWEMFSSRSSRKSGRRRLHSRRSSRLIRFCSRSTPLAPPLTLQPMRRTRSSALRRSCSSPTHAPSRWRRSAALLPPPRPLHAPRLRLTSLLSGLSLACSTTGSSPLPRSCTSGHSRVRLLRHQLGGG